MTQKVLQKLCLNTKKQSRAIKVIKVDNKKIYEIPGKMRLIISNPMTKLTRKVLNEFYKINMKLKKKERLKQ